MFTQYGEKHSELLDQGINIISVLPPEDVVGISSSYFGDGSGMLTLEQSPHVANAHMTRLRILGTVAGSGTYGDESKSSFRLSNNVSLPDGTHLLLRESVDRPQENIPDRISDNVLDAFADISLFVGKLAGNIQSTALRASKTSHNGVAANISGVILDDAMQEACIQSIENGAVLDIQHSPISSSSVPSVRYEVTTPELGQLITITMHDHRLGNREAMLAIRDK